MSISLRLGVPGLACAAVVGSFALGTSQASATACATDGGVSNCSPAEDVGVIERTRPEYDAKGIPLGGFRLFPTLDVSGTYDDNVRRQPAAQSDYFVSVTPSVRLQSQWGTHFLEAYGGIDNYNYVTFGHLNLMDWKAGTDGRLDISRAAILSANVNYGELHEALGSPNAVGSQLSPNRYYQTHANVDGVYQPNRLGIGLGGNYDHYNFLNTPLQGGGVLDNTDRNEDETQGYVKIFYDFSPGYSAFLKGLYDSRDFAHSFDRSGLRRASTGYRFQGGLDAQFSHLVKGEFFVGYLEQIYAQNVPKPLKNVSGLDYGIGVDWFATPLLTVHLNGARQLTDSVLSGVSVSEDSLIKLSADYEFRYNVLVQGYVSYTDSRYVGTTRTDSYPGAGIGVKYLMNRYLSANLNYKYSNRSSNVPRVNYSDNMVSIGVTGHI